MKKLLSFIFLLFGFIVNAQYTNSDPYTIWKGRMSIGTNQAANTSTILQLGNDSGFKTMLLPRVIATTNIANPIEGMFHYDITEHKLYYRTLTGWKAILDDAYQEVDPSVATWIKSITQTDINNWNTAFSWGNHATVGYLTSYTESDPIWTAVANNYYTKTEADGKYLQSFTESDPIWTSVAANYYTSIQSDARYLQSFTESDPIYTANGVPRTRSITINGVSHTLDSDPSWTVAASPTVIQNRIAFGNASNQITDNGAFTVNTTTPSLIIGAANLNPSIILNGSVGGAGLIYAQETNNNRWIFGKSGSRFTISRYDAAGTFVDEPFMLSGSDGTAKFSSLNDNTGISKMVIVNNGVLGYQAIPSGGTGSTTLAGLSDVNFTSQLNGQLLRFNSSTLKWENWTPDFLTSYTETDPIWSAASANYYTKTEGDARYLQSFTETDPIWTSVAANYYTKTNLQTSGEASIHWGNITNAPAFLTSYTETDPIYSANGVPKTRTLTINGTAYDLSADRSWTINAGTDSSIFATRYWSNSTFQPIGNYELQSNKATDFSVLNNTLYPTTSAVDNYIGSFNFLTNVPTWQQVITAGNSVTSTASLGSWGVDISHSGSGGGFHILNSGEGYGAYIDNTTTSTGGVGLYIVGGNGSTGQMVITNSATSGSSIFGLKINANSGGGVGLFINSGVGSNGFRYTDGNQAVGKVLTSDANGNGTWQTATGGSTDSSIYATRYWSNNTFQPIGNYLTSYTETDPVYTLNGVPKTRTITINGVSHALDADASFTVANNATQYYLENTTVTNYDTLLYFPTWDTTTIKVKALQFSPGSNKLVINKTLTDSTGLWSFDVTPGNILLSDVGGSLNVSQINASGGTAGKVLSYDGTWVTNAGGVSTFAALTDVNLTSLADKQIAQYNISTSKWENKNAAIMNLTSVANNDILKYNSTTLEWNNTGLKTINGNSLFGGGDLVITGTGDMTKAVYDINTNNVVDNSEALNSQAASYYLDRTNHTGTQAASTITGLATIATSGSASDLSAGTIPSARIAGTATDGLVAKLVGGVVTWSSDLTGGASGTLDDLTDVTITTPTTNNSLMYNGTGWVNQASAVMNLTSVANNDILKYNSTTSEWNNTALKTVNGNSLFGSGDLTISGSVSEPSGQIVYGTGTGVDSDPAFQFLTNTDAKTIYFGNSSTGYFGLATNATGGIVTSNAGDMFYRVNNKRHIWSVDDGSTIAMALSGSLNDGTGVAKMVTTTDGVLGYQEIGNFIQNQNAVQQTGNFYINGNGTLSGLYVSNLINISKTFGVNAGLELTDPSGGYIRMGGAASSGFAPAITFNADGVSQNSSWFVGQSQDAGSYPVLNFDGRKSGGVLTTQDVVGFGSYGNTYMTITAAGYLKLNTAPANDDALTQVLVRASDGTVKYRTASSIAGGGSMVYPGAGIAVSTGSAWGTSIVDNSDNWNTAYGWGNHASAGYLTSYTETDPVWSTASTNYYTKTNLQTSGQASVHWGNITNAPSFLTSFTETDPVYTASSWNSTTNNSTNWNTAYNKYVASGTFSNGTITFTRNDATTFDVTGISTGGATYLNDLLDVVNASPANGDILQFSTDNNQFNNVPFPAVEKHVGVSIISPTASEQISLFKAGANGATAVSGFVTLRGTTPSVTMAVHYGTTYGTSQGTVVASVVVNTTGATTLTINTVSIPANAYVWLVTTASSGTIDEFTPHLFYKY